MATWQITVLFAMAGCAIGCLLVFGRAIEKLTKGVSSIAAELAKMNAKMESVEAVNGDDSSLEAVEAAISNFERLKRVEVTRR